MSCPLLAEDCAADHAAPEFGLRCTQIGRQWAGPCPLCRSARSLSLTIEHGRKLWHCNRKPSPARPACDQSALMAVLSARLPGCITAAKKATGHARVAAERLAELALAGMPPMSLRLALLELAGMSTADALDKLGVRRENRSRVITGRALGTRP